MSVFSKKETTHVTFARFFEEGESGDLPVPRPDTILIFRFAGLTEVTASPTFRVALNFDGSLGSGPMKVVEPDEVKDTGDGFTFVVRHKLGLEVSSVRVEYEWQGKPTAESSSSQALEGKREFRLAVPLNQPTNLVVPTEVSFAGRALVPEEPDKKNHWPFEYGELGTPKPPEIMVEPSTLVALLPGRPLRLSWRNPPSEDVKVAVAGGGGFELEVTDPDDRQPAGPEDVPEGQDPAEWSALTVDPLTQPPDANGEYRLVRVFPSSSTESKMKIDRVRVHGIVRFTMRQTDPPAALRQRLRLVGGVGKDGVEEFVYVPEIAGRLGSFRTMREIGLDPSDPTGFPPSRPINQTWMGEVQHKDPFRVEFGFTVVKPPNGFDLLLDVNEQGKNAKFSSGTQSRPLDGVEPPTKPKAIEMSVVRLHAADLLQQVANTGLLTGTVEFQEGHLDKAQMFSADLQLRPQQAEPAKPEGQAVIRMRYDRPMPGIVDFYPVDGGGKKLPDHLFNSFTNVNFGWELKGDNSAHILLWDLYRVLETGERVSVSTMAVPTAHQLPTIAQFHPGRVLKDRGPTHKVGEQHDTTTHSEFRKLLDDLHNEKQQEVERFVAVASLYNMSGGALTREFTFYVGPAKGQHSPPSCGAPECLVPEMLERRRQYLDALEQQRLTHAQVDPKLQAAEFTLSVCKSLCEDGPTATPMRDSVHEALLGPGGKGHPNRNFLRYPFSASFLKDSLLHEDLVALRKELQVAKQKAEGAADHLCSYLEWKDLQNHLLEFHTKDLSGFVLEEVYGVGAGSATEAEHYMTLCTTNLALTERGMRFLRRLFPAYPEGNLGRKPGEPLSPPASFSLEQDMPVFAFIWKNFQKPVQVSEVLGAFFYNTAPVLKTRITAYFQDPSAFKQIKAIDKLLTPGTDPKLDKLIDHLEKSMGFDVRGMARLKLHDVAHTEAQKELVTQLEVARIQADVDATFLQNLEDDIGKPPTGPKADELRAQIKGKWFGLAFDAVSFALTIPTWKKVLVDGKDPKAQDVLALGSSLIGFYKVLLEQAELRAKLGGNTLRAAQLERYARFAGYTMTVISVVSGTYTVYQKLQEGDVEDAVLAGVGIAISLLSLAFPGIGLLLGIALAVITYYLSDPPVVEEWLEHTPWGTLHAGKPITYSKVIDKFYTVMFSEFDIDSHTGVAGKEDISISNNAIEKHTPVRVTVKDADTGKVLTPTQAHFLPEHAVDITLAPHTGGFFVIFSKGAGGVMSKLSLVRPHLNWKGMKLGRSYEIAAEIDPDVDNVPELKWIETVSY